MGGGSPRGAAGPVALGGVLAAGSLAVLWLACVAPSGRLGLTAAAGLFPLAGAVTAGRAVGYLCWGAGGVLGLLLLPDKGAALLYLMFLGLYPVVKGRIESLGGLVVEWCLKLLYFNAALTAAWFLLRQLLFPNPPAWMAQGLWAVYLAGNGAFVVYDVGLSRLVALLRARLRPGRRR